MRRDRLVDCEPPSADEEVARLRLRLNHYSLSELEARGVLARDEDEHVVRKAGLFDEVWDEIRRVGTVDRRERESPAGCESVGSSPARRRPRGRDELDEVADTIHAHPTLSEVVQAASCDARDRD